MLPNAYSLAKFRFDRAENEPAKNLQNFANFPNLARAPSAGVGRRPTRGVLRGVLRRRDGVRDL